MKRTDHSSSYRVLLIDDHPDTLEVLATIFAMLGHTPECVSRGRDALKAARAFDPDLVLLDLGLPDISGYEVMSALRNEPGRRRRFIAAVTGSGRPQDITRALGAGFDEHVTKPMDLAKIRQLLRLVEARLRPRPSEPVATA